MRTAALALFLAVSTMILGCTKEGADSSGESTEGKGPLVTKFRMGPLAGGDGTVTREGDSFQHGEPIHISFEVKNVPKASPIRVVWRDSARQEISKEEKPLPSKGAIAFALKDTGNLAPGDYVVEFSRAEPAAPQGWAGLGTKTFKVGPKP